MIIMSLCTGLDLCIKNINMLSMCNFLAYQLYLSKAKAKKQGTMFKQL